VLLFNYGDIRLQEFLIDASYPSAEMLRAMWRRLAESPERTDDDIEDRLRRVLPGEPSKAAVGAAIRILERHGMIARDGDEIRASRPGPGQFPPLDVEALTRRADSERGKLRTMVEYAYHPRCRRQHVLEYFGDEDWRDRGKRCGACDNCEAVALGKQTGLTTGELEAVRSLLMLVGTLHGRFGRTRIASLANGTDDDDRFGELAERGCLRGWSQKHVLDLLRALEGAGLVEASRGEYPTISTTKRGDLVAIGRIDAAELAIQMPVVAKKSRRRR
jgi:ATP-dependent DNA helicase RecQ